MFLQVMQTFPFVSIIFTSSNADPGQFLPNLTRMLSCESDARYKPKKKKKDKMHEDVIKKKKKKKKKEKVPYLLKPGETLIT